MITHEAYADKLTRVFEAAWLLPDNERREVVMRASNSSIYYDALGRITIPESRESYFASAVWTLDMAIAYLNKYGKLHRGDAWKSLNGLGLSTNRTELQ